MQLLILWLFFALTLHLLHLDEGTRSLAQAAPESFLVPPFTYLTNEDTAKDNDALYRDDILNDDEEVDETKEHVFTCSPVNHPDGFLIIGAGISGLAAAHYLHAFTKNCPVTVLEADSVPGGRIRTIRDGGAFDGCEAGAGWIHGEHENPLVALSEILALPTKWVGGDSSYIGGDNIQLFDGKEKVIFAL